MIGEFAKIHRRLSSLFVPVIERAFKLVRGDGASCLLTNLFYRRQGLRCEALTPIWLSCVVRLKPAHPRHQVGLRRFDQQMVMIGHQNERVHTPPRAPTHLAERGHELLAIGVITENRFLPVAAIQQMINGSGELDTCFPGHERSQTSWAIYPWLCENPEILRLTPSTALIPHEVGL